MSEHSCGVGQESKDELFVDIVGEHESDHELARERESRRFQYSNCSEGESRRSHYSSFSEGESRRSEFPGFSEGERHELRGKINSRERKRMHDLNSAMDSLREVMPVARGPAVRKLSKMSTLALARSYIESLSRSVRELTHLIDDLYRSAGQPRTFHRPLPPHLHTALAPLSTASPPGYPYLPVHVGPSPGGAMSCSCTVCPYTLPSPPSSAVLSPLSGTTASMLGLTLPEKLYPESHKQMEAFHRL